MSNDRYADNLGSDLVRFDTAGPFDFPAGNVALTTMQSTRATFMSLRNRLFESQKAERGASMVEYALLVILIAIVAFVAVRIAGENVSTAFSTVADGFVNPN
jgi:Flp pilus assembly pilin Flp